MTEVKRDPLLAGLKRVLPCVAGKDSRVEVYKCVRVEEGKLYTFDGNQGAVTASGLPDNLKFGVNAEALAAVLSAFAEEINLELDGSLKLYSGKTKADLPLVPDDQDWPEFLGAEQNDLITAENFFEALQSAAFCLDANSVRTSIPPHVLVKDSFMYTTDGVRACKVKLDTPATRITRLPLEFVRLLLKQGKPDFLFEGNGIGAVYAETATLYVTREIKTPDYSERLSDGFLATNQEYDLPDWSKPLSFAGGVSSGRDEKVSVEISNGQARIAYQNKDTKIRVEQTVPCPGGQSFHSNLRFLSQAIAQNPTKIDFGGLPNRLRFARDGWEHLLALNV